MRPLLTRAALLMGVLALAGCPKWELDSAAVSSSSERAAPASAQTAVATPAAASAAAVGAAPVQA
ncbi:hypothetical protein, partial [Lysobacter sp. TAB13]|uniref:hypothetical protein n=1 Tax=Lysobacter sp. TAB13 TaxID=3233065 RepID=UPI003F99AC3A